MIKCVIPEGLLGRFAIVKLWPEIKAAEDECIARLKVSAKALGLECIEIHSDGRLLHNPSITISKNDVDFVLHLHYDTPKLYDAFSFVALWNPIEFYHSWGYARCSRNLLSHDDFLSCSADPADHHLRRVIRSSAIHLPPFFNLYHSVADVVYPPSLGEHKLFYAGINWDVLGGGKSRHQELLKKLDEIGIIKIYGPHIFQGVPVWKGYKSYIDEIPFDGVSIMKKIADAGIGLVLSSKAHKQSELMSNRLFESIASGALIICDENKFAKKFFGDTLLYIDSRCSVEETFQAILSHLNWAKNNPQDAIEMITNAQNIFKKQFTLNKSLHNLYQGLIERKVRLSKINYPPNVKKIKIGLYLLIPKYSHGVLKNHINSILLQEYEDFTPTIVIDRVEASQHHHINNALSGLKRKINIVEIDFFKYGVNDNIKEKRNTGEILFNILENNEHDAVIFVAPNETLFSNHLQILAGSLARNPTIGCIATATIIKNKFNITHTNYEKIDFRQLYVEVPIGFARFIFRLSNLPKDLSIALPYVDRKTMAILIGNNEIYQEPPATVIIDAGMPFPENLWDEAYENELISNFSPGSFKVYRGHEIVVPNLTYANTPKNSRVKKTIFWILTQMKALRRDGLISRITAFKKKFVRFITQEEL